MSKINSTLVTGFITQVQSMIDKLRSFEGYNEEDYNPYWEAVSDLEDALDSLDYVKRDLKSG